SAGATANASLSLTVTPALAVSTTALPSGTVGSSYSTTITASGGTPPYSWSGAGGDGLSLSAAGVLSGTPAQPGTLAESITVSDSAGATATSSLSLSITAA